MWQFIHSFGGLVAAVLALIAAIIGLIAALLDKLPKNMTKKWNKLLYYLLLAILFIFGVSVIITWKRPAVAILSPSGSIPVTAEDDSVWFPVSGSSSGVASNSTFAIYVLVWSDPEWHVQRPAIVEQDGRWTLTQAWIGDASTPIDTGTEIRLMAVVSRGRYSPGNKISDYRELDPVAQSAMVSVRVTTVRGR